MNTTQSNGPESLIETIPPRRDYATDLTPRSVALDRWRSAPPLVSAAASGRSPA